MVLEFLDKEKAIASAKEQKKEYPKEIWNVVESKGYFYVENGTPFIRTWEKLIYTTDN